MISLILSQSHRYRSPGSRLDPPPPQTPPVSMAQSSFFSPAVVRPAAADCSSQPRSRSPAVLSLAVRSPMVGPEDGDRVKEKEVKPTAVESTSRLELALPLPQSDQIKPFVQSVSGTSLVALSDDTYRHPGTSHREEKSRDELERSMVRGQTDWGVTYSSHQICAFKGSTVDIPCTYTYPPRIDELDTKVEETLWFTKLNGDQHVDLRSDPDYSGRVEYLFEQNDCTLRIKDLRETDSAEYKFRENSRVTLICSSDGYPTPEFTWYKRNQHGYLRKGSELVFRSIKSSDSGEYYCSAQNGLGRERTSGFTSVDVKFAPKTPSVSQSPSGEVMEGRAVTLSCSSDANPAASYTWYKVDRNQRRQLFHEGAQLVFRSIQSSDSGLYFCSAKNDMGTLTSGIISVDVKYAPKPPSVSVSPSGEIVEGSSVTLTCSSDANPAANYTWFKKDEDSPKATGEIFTLENTGAEHSGDYVCVAQNEKGHHNSTVHVTVVGGSWKGITAATVSIIMIALILIFVVIWIM
ncbi:sialoadhesin-like [Halichoeres trimaculatus]|uniref:sialoadhesin-like n=1 Tax=Halichoeres trimaculatus TaxID=147232 RepID=UPI003D9E22F8